jgi:hypothetical protein
VDLAPADLAVLSGDEVADPDLGLDKQDVPTRLQKSAGAELEVIR